MSDVPLRDDIRNALHVLRMNAQERGEMYYVSTAEQYLLHALRTLDDAMSPRDHDPDFVEVYDPDRWAEMSDA